MAGLLGNIATAAGNNMAQYAHTQHQQNFQRQQQQSHQDFARELEENRAARAERLAKRQRGWQVEDRDAQLNMAMDQARGQAQREETTRAATTVNDQVQYLEGRLDKLSAEYREATSGMEPVSPQAMTSLNADIDALKEELQLLLQQTDGGLLQHAGLAARKQTLMNRLRRLEEERARSNAQQQEASTQAARQAEVNNEQRAQQRQDAVNRILNRSSFGL